MKQSKTRYQLRNHTGYYFNPLLESQDLSIILCTSTRVLFLSYQCNGIAIYEKALNVIFPQSIKTRVSFDGPANYFVEIAINKIKLVPTLRIIFASFEPPQDSIFSTYPHHPSNVKGITEELFKHSRVEVFQRFILNDNVDIIIRCVEGRSSPKCTGTETECSAFVTGRCQLFDPQMVQQSRASAWLQ